MSDEYKCFDCRAPVPDVHYRCWWCKMAFCRDCAPKHFGGPDDMKPGALAERIKNAVDDDRVKVLRLIEDEQAFLTAGDKKLLRERLLDLWMRG